MAVDQDIKNGLALVVFRLKGKRAKAQNRKVVAGHLLHLGQPEIQQFGFYTFGAVGFFDGVPPVDLACHLGHFLLNFAHFSLGFLVGLDLAQQGLAFGLFGFQFGQGLGRVGNGVQGVNFRLDVLALLAVCFEIGLALFDIGQGSLLLLQLAHFLREGFPLIAQGPLLLDNAFELVFISAQGFIFGSFTHLFSAGGTLITQGFNPGFFFLKVRFLGDARGDLALQLALFLAKRRQGISYFLQLFPDIRVEFPRGLN